MRKIAWIGALTSSIVGFSTGIAHATSVTFLPTAHEQTFIVPAGVTTIHAVAVGGKGGDGQPGTGAGGTGGFGGLVSADLLVTPGEVLYVEVGGNGQTGASGGAAGFNGGGAGGVGGFTTGGGGGGASDVRLAPRTAGTSLSLRLLTAAGGGGGGADHDPGAPASTGGAPGQAGGAGDGGGGGGGTTSGGGAAAGTGECAGQPGELGAGGAGGTSQCEGLGSGGGGGGGGIYGGGGGGGSSAGGGGGGGASGFGTGAINTSASVDSTGAPSITFVYTQSTSTHTLTIGKSGSGNVTSTDGSINCGSTCSHAYASGAHVTLHATPGKGWRFGGWSGGCSGRATCSLTMASNTSVKARFKRLGLNTVITGTTISTRSASFRFKATAKSKGFQCALRSKKHPHAKFKSCHSTKSYKNLGRGTYTFLVRALGSKAPDPTPARRQFTIT